MQLCVEGGRARNLIWYSENHSWAELALAGTLAFGCGWGMWNALKTERVCQVLKFPYA